MINEAKPDDVEVPAARRSVLLDAANTLADARRTKNPIASLPENLRPQTVSEAYVVQDELATAFGEAGGWKVGAASAESTPTCAPMPRMWTAASGAEFRALRYRGVEAEIAFRLGADLPRSNSPYSRHQVLAAIESCHPAIEVLDSAFENPLEVDRLSALADLGLHGAFCYGPSVPDWASIDFSAEKVNLFVDGVVRVERTGSNAAGDLIALLVWLANEGGPRTNGLSAGQWITTGSWTGSVLAENQSSVKVVFGSAGQVSLRFSPEQNLEKGLPGVTRRFS